MQRRGATASRSEQTGGATPIRFGGEINGSELAVIEKRAFEVISDLLIRCASCEIESRIAVPPAVRTLPIASSIVCASLVGPVTGRSPVVNGATMTLSSFLR